MIKWLFHERHNIMALADCSGYLPVLYICETEYDETIYAETIFTTCPLDYIHNYGWIEIGSL